MDLEVKIEEYTHASWSIRAEIIACASQLIRVIAFNDCLICLKAD